MNIDTLKSLVDLFYPLVEFAIFDRKGNVQEVLNAFSTLKQDQECEVNSIQLEVPFLEQLASGRHCRSLIYPIENGRYVRIRFDQTPFKSLHEQLSLIMNSKEHEIGETWKEAIDHAVQNYFSKNKINKDAATQQQKRELIAQLHEKKLLEFKESSAYIAAKLQISRATVYNYLKITAAYKKIHIHQVDTFTSERFGGNPAGVVLEADDLDEQTMRKITRELNLSETSFVSSSKKGDFKLQYYTPTGHDVVFCGHSTVGALYMIAKEHLFGAEGPGTYSFDVETSCGVLNMEVSIGENEEIEVAYESPEIRLIASSISHKEVARASGIDFKSINLQYPVMYEETNQDLYVVLNSLKELEKIDCDFKSLSQFSKQHDIVALCAFCPETYDSANQFHMRCFAPRVGIPEDPFTGSVLGGLTAYVDQFKLLPAKTRKFSVEQGHCINRPGVVTVEFNKSNGRYKAKVIAHAVHCFSSAIQLT